MILLVIAFLGSVLAALMTDVVRLGPSQVALPTDALVITPVWYRYPDGDPASDYYMLLVQVDNHLDSDSILPYAIVVNVSTKAGEIIGGWYPSGGEYRQRETLNLHFGGSPPAVSLDLPAGFVDRKFERSYLVWNVQGEHSFRSQPIFRDRADFLVEGIRLPENSMLDLGVDVLLTWYYTNVFQAYPVASQGASANCYYVPEIDSEGTAPYASCA